ncbi:MAG: hypothetical protein VKJ04_01090 [Vampirovibrionales bacterium]|nr:hypothetical protein [Vampirovibrionales bacterium]
MTLSLSCPTMASRNTRPLHFGNRRLVAENLVYAFKDLGYNTLQDATTLRNNALILSSLLLVLTRIGITNTSALKAQGTPQAHHRQQEALKTTIREIGGFTLSFVVFRAVQYFMERWMRHVFQIPENVTLIKSTISNFKKAVRNGMNGEALPKHRPFLEHGVKAPENPDEMLKTYRRLKLDKLFNMFSRHNMATLNPAEKLALITDRVQFTVRTLPILVASVPALLLSGYYLEKYTQKHANQAAETISQLLSKHVDRKPVNPFIGH